MWLHCLFILYQCFDWLCESLQLFVFYVKTVAEKQRKKSVKFIYMIALTLAEHTGSVKPYRGFNMIGAGIQKIWNICVYKELIIMCCPGIKLVIELIPNHTSRRHKWFIQSRQSASNPYSNFYIWDNGRRFENGSRYPPNNWVMNICAFIFLHCISIGTQRLPSYMHFFEVRWAENACHL